MIKHLLRGFVAGIAVSKMVRCRRVSIELLRIEAAKWYLRGLQMTRLSALGLMGMGLVITLIGVGLLLLHAGLFILLPWTVEAKALLGVGLGLVYVVVGAIALRLAMDEKMWMEKSGATRMVEEATRPSRSE